MNFSFQNQKDDSLRYSGYYTYLQGEFVWGGTKFYVFYRYVDACGYYNGISLIPVHGEKRFIDLSGGIGDADVYYWSINTVQENDSLKFEETSWYKNNDIAEVVESRGVFVNNLNGLSKRKKNSKLFDIRHDDEDGIIDTVNVRYWFPRI